MEIVNESMIETIHTWLNDGKAIALPTDTVYGLILKASKDNEHVLKQIKQRPEDKPLPMVVSSVDELLELIEVPNRYLDVVKSNLPGGLTIVGNAKQDYGHPTLAVRVPDKPYLLESLKGIGPCWLTSANISGQPACFTVDQVKATLSERIGYIVDGPCISNVASTIVSFVEEQPKILRQGALKLDL